MAEVERPEHTREAGDVAGHGQLAEPSEGSQNRQTLPTTTASRSSAFTRGHESACPHEDLCTRLTAASLGAKSNSNVHQQVTKQITANPYNGTLLSEKGVNYLYVRRHG